MPIAVFLHGFLGTGADWAAIVTNCSYPVYTPNLPGHGGTPLLPGRQRYATWVNWLAVYLSKHYLPPVDLVGYSLGGRVALAFALAYPSRVRTLVLESVNPGLGDPQARAERARLDTERAAFIRRHGLKAFLEAWYHLPLWQSLNRYPGLREQLITQRSHQDPEAMARVVTEMSPGVQPDLTPHLSQLKMPVLIITGEMDTTYTQRWQALLPHLPHAQQVIVPNAGHNVHLEQPEAYRQALQAFWSLQS